MKKARAFSAARIRRCVHSFRSRPSFETLASQAPQDEVIARGALFDPHGEEARSAVSNHEAPILRSDSQQTSATESADFAFVSKYRTAIFDAKIADCRAPTLISGSIPCPDLILISPGEIC